MATCDPDVIIDQLFRGISIPGGKTSMKAGMNAIVALGQKRTDLKAEIMEDSILYMAEAALVKSSEVTEKGQSFLDTSFDAPSSDELLNHPRVSDADIILHSGGALESDTVWGEIASKLKMIVNHYYVKEKGKYSSAKPPKANAPITEEEYKLGVNMATAAGRATGKLQPTHVAGNTLNIRNSVQIMYSDAVVAVAEKFIEKDEALDQHNHIAKKKVVSGGTGLAVEMGIQKGIPVYVIMETKNGPTWYEAKGDDFIEMNEEPDLSEFNSITGIGTRAKTTKGLSVGIKAKMTSVLTNMNTKKNMKKLDSSKQSSIKNILSSHSGTNLKKSSTVSATHIVTGTVHDNGSAFVEKMNELDDYKGFDINHNFGNPFVIDLTEDKSYGFSILNETSSTIDGTEKIDATIAYYNWLNTGTVPSGYAGDTAKLSERREWAISRLSKLSLFTSTKGNTIGSVGASQNNMQYGLSDNMVLETIIQKNHKKATPKNSNSSLFNDPLFDNGEDINEVTDSVTIVDTAGKNMSILSNSKGVVLKKGTTAKKGFYNKKTKKQVAGKKGTKTTYKKLYEGIDKDGKKKMFDTVARAYSSQTKGKTSADKKTILSKLVQTRMKKDTEFKKALMATEGKAILYPSEDDLSAYVTSFRKMYVEVLEEARDEVLNSDPNKAMPKKNAKFGGRPEGSKSLTPSGSTIIEVAKSIMNQLQNGIKYIIEWNPSVENIFNAMTPKELEEVFEESLSSNDVVMDKKYEDILSDTHDNLNTKHKLNKEKIEETKKKQAKNKKIKDAKEKFSKPKNITSVFKINIENYSDGLPDFVHQITGIKEYYKIDKTKLQEEVVKMVLTRTEESASFKKSLLSTGSGKLSHASSAKLNKKFAKSPKFKKANYSKVMDAYLAALTTVRKDLLDQVAEESKTKNTNEDVPWDTTDGPSFTEEEIKQATQDLDAKTKEAIDENKEC